MASGPAPRSSSRGEPVGLSRQRAVGECAVTADHGGGVRIGGGPGGEHRGNRGPGPVGPARDLVRRVLSGQAYVDGADGTVRGRGDLVEHLDVALRQPFHGVPVEQRGRILKGAAQSVAGVRTESEEEVELGRVGESQLPLGTHTRQVECGQSGLPGVQDLEQRVPGVRSLRIDQLDHAVEGCVLVVVGGDGLLTGLGQHVVEGQGGGEAHPEHPGVDEEADQFGQCLVGAPGDGGPDREVVAAAELVEQHGERCLADDPGGGTPSAGQLLHPGPQPRWYGELDTAAAAPGGLGPGAVGGQGQRRGWIVQLTAPVLQLPAQEAAERLLGGGQQAALPHRVIGVLHRQVGPVRCPARDTCRVRGRQVAAQRQHGGAVAGDVVQREDQHVPSGAEPEHLGPQGQIGREVEGARGEGRGLGVDLVGADRADRHVESEPPGRQHHLGGDTGGVLGDHRPQGLVPTHHVPQGVGERLGVECSGEVEDRRDVVGRGRFLEPVEEPQALLGTGERHRIGALHAHQRRPGAGPGVQFRGQIRHHGRAEDHADGQLDAQMGADPVDEPGRQQRVPAQQEEVVVGPDPFLSDQFGVEPGEEEFVLPLGLPVPRLVLAGAGSSVRSSLPCALSGSSSRTTNAAGTMNRGSRDAAKSRSPSSRIPAAPARGTTYATISFSPSTPVASRAMTAASDTPGHELSTASISPGSMRKPLIFTWPSTRPRNASCPEDPNATTSPVRYIRLPGRPGQATKRSAVALGRPL